MRKYHFKLKKVIWLISIMTIIVTAALATWNRNKQSHQKKYEKSQGDYGVYYSGTFDVADYQFINHETVVIKWSSKFPREDRLVNKYSDKTQTHIPPELAYAGTKFIVRENVKVKDLPGSGSFKRNTPLKGEYWNLAIYKKSDKKLEKKVFDIFTEIRNYNKDLIPIGVSGVVTTDTGKEAVIIYLQSKKTNKKLEKLIDLESRKIVNGKPSDKRQPKAEIGNFPLVNNLPSYINPYKNLISYSGTGPLNKNSKFAKEYKQAFKLFQSTYSKSEEYPYKGNKVNLYILSTKPDTKLYTDVLELFYPKGTNIYKNYTLSAEDSLDGKDHVVNSYDEFMKYYNTDKLYGN